MSTDVLERPPGNATLPIPESERQRRCTRCHRWLPIEQFRFANAAKENATPNARSVGSNWRVRVASVAGAGGSTRTSWLSPAGSTPRRRWQHCARKWAHRKALTMRQAAYT